MEVHDAFRPLLSKLFIFVVCFSFFIVSGIHHVLHKANNEAKGLGGEGKE